MKNNLISTSRRLMGGVGLGIGLMTRSEKNRALLLVVTSMINAVMQILVLIGLAAMIRFTVDESFALPAWFAKIIGSILSASDRRSIGLALGAALAVLVGLKVALSWVHLAWMAQFSASCENRLSSFLMRRTLLAPYDWLVRQNPERLRQLLFGFVSSWSREFIRNLMRIANDIIMAAFVLALILWAQPQVGILVAGIATVLGSIIFLVVRPRMRRLAEQKRKGILGASTISTECIHGVKDVKMAGAEAHFSDLFDEQVALYSNGDAEAQSWAQLPRHVLELAAYGGLICAALFVALFNVPGSGIADALLLYALAAMRLMPIFSTLVGGLSSLTSSLPIVRDLRKLIDQTGTTESTVERKVDELPWQRVRFERVSFSYQNAPRAALKEVSIEIEHGKSYGIVGQSGAGKSTFIDVLAGLLPISAGSVTVDGMPLGEHNRRNWRSRFGYVSQRPFLLDGSLKRNVVFNSSGEANLPRLQRALEFACLDKVVARLKRGVDGNVGSQGALLSGGERQRVAIARALYRGADMLILDEATSSLDVLVEQEIADSMEALKGHVTTFVVSHRLNFIRHCDQILLFEDGLLSAVAPHEQLMESSLLYRSMVRGTKEMAA